MFSVYAPGMPTGALVVVQMFMSLLAWGLLAWVAFAPPLARLPRRRALLYLALPQLFRHLGTNQLSPMVGPGMPDAWAWHVAVGDSVTVMLAIVAVVALKRGYAWALVAAWAVNLVGCADLLFNGFNAARLGVAPHLGAAWYIPAFGVPGMLVAHLLSFWQLRRPENGPQAEVGEKC